MEMTENDLRLIKKCYELRDWDLVADLEEQADSEECKRILKDRRMRLYHNEEFSAGIL